MPYNADRKSFQAYRESINLILLLDQIIHAIMPESGGYISV